MNGFEDIPYLRFLDIEGEDGGLPLMEYCKNEGIELSEELSSDDIVGDFLLIKITKKIS